MNKVSNCKKNVCNLIIRKLRYFKFNDTTIAILGHKSDKRRKNQGLLKISMFFQNLLGAVSTSFVCIYPP